MPHEYEAQHKGLGSTNFKLPVDIANPGYTFFKQSHQERLDAIAQYVTPEEYKELASGVNTSITAHHYCNKPCATLPAMVTLGVCFCPLIYYADQMDRKVNEDIAAAAVAQRLNERGIGLRWEKRTKFNNGGLTFGISDRTPHVQQMQRELPPAVSSGTLMAAIVPPGSKAGDTILVPTPTGNVQVNVPAGAVEGMEFQFHMP